MGSSLSDFDKGLLLGLLINAGHFGGDGRQAQVTIKMHVRHARLVRWLHSRIPASRLYGPYHHGGRHYLQLMVRGQALHAELAPVLRPLPWQEVDDYSHGRFVAMMERYGAEVAVVTPGSLP